MGLASLLRCFVPHENATVPPETPQLDEASPLSPVCEPDKSYDVLVLTQGLHKCTVENSSPLHQLRAALNIIVPAVGATAASVAVFSHSFNTYACLASSGMPQGRWTTTNVQLLSTDTLVAQALCSKDEFVSCSAAGPLPEDVRELASTCNFQSFCAAPIVSGDRKQGVLVLCGSSESSFSSSRNKSLVIVAKCWLAQAFKKGCLQTYSTNLEQVCSASTMQDLVQKMMQLLHTSFDDASFSMKVQCSIATVTNDGLSAIHYGLSANSKEDRRPSTALHPIYDTVDVIQSDDVASPQDSAHWLLKSAPSILRSDTDLLETAGSWSRAGEVVPAHTHLLDGTLLNELRPDKTGLIIADCLVALQVRSSKKSEVLIATSSPVS